MQNRQTVTVVNPDQVVVGYIINTGLSGHGQEAIRRVQNVLSAAFPFAVWAAPPNALHITLMDWLAPLVDYGQDKDELFRSIKAEYSKALTDVLKCQSPIRVQFDAIEVYPGAIIVKGRDDGSYQRIREAFLNKITLLPGTKRPPQIVHTTICKFVRDVDLAEVKEVLRGETVHFEEKVTKFRLAREGQIFMQQYKITEQFRLNQ